MPYPREKWNFRPHPVLENGHAQTILGIRWPSKRAPYQALPHQVLLDDGDKVVIHEDRPEQIDDAQDCVLMIHDGDSDLGGHAKNVERWAEHSKQSRRRLYEIYLEKMKIKNKALTLKKVESLCTIDTIYSAEEAINVGLADHVIDNFEVLRGE